jgi:hypothetical protein
LAGPAALQPTGETCTVERHFPILTVIHGFVDTRPDGQYQLFLSGNEEMR